MKYLRYYHLDLKQKKNVMKNLLFSATAKTKGPRNHFLPKNTIKVRNFNFKQLKSSLIFL